jgi:hypothetical protein
VGVYGFVLLGTVIAHHMLCARHALTLRP